MTRELDTLLVSRLRRGSAGALAHRSGSLLLEAGPEACWTVTVESGRAALRRGRTAKPDAVVRTDPDTLAEVVTGACSGAQAFLDGRLTVRGDLSLSLGLDGAFDTPERPAEHPRLGVAEPLGVQTTYLEAGPEEAPPVLLLHGLGATSASMLPLVTGLAPDYRVIAPDLPGHGATAAPLWAYTPREMASWAAALAAELSLGPVAVVGNSLGGRIALELALTAPDRVRALALLCPSPAFRRLRQLVPAARLVPPSLAMLPTPITPHPAVVRGIRLMFSQPSRLPRSWYDAGADEHRRVMSSPRHRRAFFACLRQVYVEDAYGDKGFWDRLPGITAPALFVWGDRDRLVPAGFARHVSAALPHARSQVLADCGHVPQFEHPAATLGLVRHLLAGA